MEMKIYKFADGSYVSKGRMDRALALVARLAEGFEIVEGAEHLSELSEIDAIICYKEKHDCSLMEARDAVRFLREK